ncbi:MAG: hypothetical protein K2Q01_00250, partial [Rickettsiales bacterium]|nr:hypothetical protein [Rickettsiales bacterium]
VDPSRITGNVVMRQAPANAAEAEALMKVTADYFHFRERYAPELVALAERMEAHKPKMEEWTRKYGNATIQQLQQRGIVVPAAEIAGMAQYALDMQRYATLVQNEQLLERRYLQALEKRPVETDPAKIAAYTQKLTDHRAATVALRQWTERLGLDGPPANARVKSAKGVALLKLIRDRRQAQLKMNELLLSGNLASDSRGLQGYGSFATLQNNQTLTQQQLQELGALPAAEQAAILEANAQYNALLATQANKDAMQLVDMANAERLSITFATPLPDVLRSQEMRQVQDWATEVRAQAQNGTYSNAMFGGANATALSSEQEDVLREVYRRAALEGELGRNYRAADEKASLEAVARHFHIDLSKPKEAKTTWTVTDLVPSAYQLRPDPNSNATLALTPQTNPARIRYEPIQAVAMQVYRAQDIDRNGDGQISPAEAVLLQEAIRHRRARLADDISKGSEHVGSQREVITALTALARRNNITVEAVNETLTEKALVVTGLVRRSYDTPEENDRKILAAVATVNGIPTTVEQRQRILQEVDQLLMRERATVEGREVLGRLRAHTQRQNATYQITLPAISRTRHDTAQETLIKMRRALAELAHAERERHSAVDEQIRTLLTSDDNTQRQRGRDMRARQAAELLEKQRKLVADTLAPGGFLSEDGWQLMQEMGTQVRAQSADANFPFAQDADLLLMADVATQFRKKLLTDGEIALRASNVLHEELTNEYGTEAGAVARRAAIIARIDANNDGKLDAAELAVFNSLSRHYEHSIANNLRRDEYYGANSARLLLNQLHAVAGEKHWTGMTPPSTPSREERAYRVVRGELLLRDDNERPLLNPDTYRVPEGATQEVKDEKDALYRRAQQEVRGGVFARSFASSAAAKPELTAEELALAYAMMRVYRKGNVGGSDDMQRFVDFMKTKYDVEVDTSNERTLITTPADRLLDERVYVLMGRVEGMARPATPGGVVPTPAQVMAARKAAFAEAFPGRDGKLTDDEQRMLVRLAFRASMDYGLAEDSIAALKEVIRERFKLNLDEKATPPKLTPADAPQQPPQPGAMGRAPAARPSVTGDAGFDRILATVIDVLPGGGFLPAPSPVAGAVVRGDKESKMGSAT